MRRTTWCLAVVGVWCAAPRGAAAQSRDGWLRQGIGAYEQLDYPIAAAVLRRGLAADAPSALPDSSRTVALVYLGASELFRGRADSAVAAVRRLGVFWPAVPPGPVCLSPRGDPPFPPGRPATPAAARRP